MRVSAFFLCALSLAFLGSLTAAEPDFSRRIFDFTPVSESNPVVARIGDTIEIPASEYRAFQQAEKLRAITDPASLAQKHAVLAALIDEYLFVENARSLGVVDTAEFKKRMAFTRAMLLTDFLSADVFARCARTPADNAKALAEFSDQLYEAADIRISNEAYDLFQRAAAAIEKTSAASRLGPVIEPPEAAAARLRSLVQSVPDAVLARYNQTAISVKEILVIYAGLPPPRPHVDTHETFLALLKPRIVPDLMATEAERLGLDRQPAFQNKLIENQNALLRFQAHGSIEAAANKILRAPDLDQRLEAWFRENSIRYSPALETGDAKKIPAFSDVKGRVLADFSVDLCERLLAERAQALRQSSVIVINEAVLKTL